MAGIFKGSNILCDLKDKTHNVKMKELIKVNGGTVISRKLKDGDILITDQRGKSYLLAVEKSIDVHSPEWIEESIKKGHKLSDGEYTEINEEDDSSEDDNDQTPSDQSQDHFSSEDDKEEDQTPLGLESHMTQSQAEPSQNHLFQNINTIEDGIQYSQMESQQAEGTQYSQQDDDDDDDDDDGSAPDIFEESLDFLTDFTNRERDNSATIAPIPGTSKSGLKRTRPDSQTGDATAHDELKLKKRKESDDITTIRGARAERRATTVKLRPLTFKVNGLIDPDAYIDRPYVPADDFMNKLQEQILNQPNEKREFKFILITAPSQSGKSTMIKHLQRSSNSSSQTLTIIYVNVKSKGEEEQESPYKLTMDAVWEQLYCYKLIRQEERVERPKTFPEIVTMIAEKLPKDTYRKITFVFDELDEITSWGPQRETFLKELRELKSHPEAGFFACVGISNHSGQYLFTKAGSPFNIREHMSFPYFTLTEMTRLFDQATVSNGYDVLDPKVVASIYKMSCGAQGLTQQLGDVLLRASDNQSKLIDLKQWNDVTTGVNFIRDLTGQGLNLHSNFVRMQDVIEQNPNAREMLHKLLCDGDFGKVNLDNDTASNLVKHNILKINYNKLVIPSNEKLEIKNLYFHYEWANPVVKQYVKLRLTTDMKRPDNYSMYDGGRLNIKRFLTTLVHYMDPFEVVFGNKKSKSSENKNGQTRVEAVYVKAFNSALDKFKPFVCLEHETQAPCKEKGCSTLFCDDKITLLDVNYARHMVLIEHCAGVTISKNSKSKKNRATLHHHVMSQANVYSKRLVANETFVFVWCGNNQQRRIFQNQFAKLTQDVQIVYIIHDEYFLNISLEFQDATILVNRYRDASISSIESLLKDMYYIGEIDRLTNQLKKQGSMGGGSESGALDYNTIGVDELFNLLYANNKLKDVANVLKAKGVDGETFVGMIAKDYEEMNINLVLETRTALRNIVREKFGNDAYLK